MGPLLKIIGLLILLGGLGLAGSAYGDGSVFGMGLALVVFAIGAYALVAGSREGASGSPPLSSSAPTRPGPSPSAPGSGLKVCPDCAETVHAAARKCRYCGFMFDESTITSPLPAPGGAPSVFERPGARERLARALGSPPDQASAVPGEGIPPRSGGFALPGSDLYNARLRARIRTASPKDLSPATQVVYARLSREFGEQWCDACGEQVLPQVSATGAAEELWKCSACGKLTLPTPRRG